MLLFLHPWRRVCIGFLLRSPRVCRQVCRGQWCPGTHSGSHFLPEHPFPAALEDTLTAYGWLLAQGTSPSRIVSLVNQQVVGAALATLLALRDKGIPLPAAAVVLVSLTEFFESLTGESHQTRGESQLYRSPPGMAMVCSQYYAGENDRGLPWISPLYGDLQGLLSSPNLRRQ